MLRLGLREALTDSERRDGLLPSASGTPVLPTVPAVSARSRSSSRSLICMAEAHFSIGCCISCCIPTAISSTRLVDTLGGASGANHDLQSNCDDGNKGIRLTMRSFLGFSRGCCSPQSGADCRRPEQCELEVLGSLSSGVPPASAKTCSLSFPNQTMQAYLLQRQTYPTLLCVSSSRPCWHLPRHEELDRKASCRDWKTMLWRRSPVEGPATSAENGREASVPKGLVKTL